MTEPRVSTRKLLSWVVSGGATAVLVGLMTLAHELRAAMASHDAFVKAQGKAEAMREFDHSRIEYLMAVAENHDKQAGWETVVMTEIAMRVGIGAKDLPPQPLLRQPPAIGVPPLASMRSVQTIGMAP